MRELKQSKLERNRIIRNILVYKTIKPIDIWFEILIGGFKSRSKIINIEYRYRKRFFYMFFGMISKYLNYIYVDQLPSGDYRIFVRIKYANYDLIRNILSLFDKLAKCDNLLDTEHIEAVSNNSMFNKEFGYERY